MDINVSMMQSTASLGGSIDLVGLAKKFPASKYDPEKFPGVRYKPDISKSLTFLIYGNGKIVITGGKSFKELEEAGIDFAGKIGRKLDGLKVHCVVGTASLGNKGFNLDKLVTISDEMHYNPEIFPGVIFRPAQWKPRFLIFDTSKVVIAGARSLDELGEAGVWFEKFVNEHKECLK